MSSSEAPANIRVLVRVRPLNEREEKLSSTKVLNVDNGSMAGNIDFGSGRRTSIRGEDLAGGTISVHDPSSTGGYSSDGGNPATGTLSSSSSRFFSYDAVFGPRSQQSEIFDSIRGIIDAVCAGYNGTIVAYGQTGSGKTHTIFGEEGSDDSEHAGLVQRSLKSIFHKIAESHVGSLTDEDCGTIRTTTRASFFEIYNERVYDLLPEGDSLEVPLSVREDSSKGVYVEGLAEIEVTNTSEAMDVLRCGMANRHVAATNMNRVSSRSHAVFALTLQSVVTSSEGISKVRMSKFSLVDLAGSERQKATDTAGDRLKEASMINNSLLCLGQVINSLVDRENGKERHVPFRDSKLTFLLRDSWGGNSKTCLVATVTPSILSITETISTLKFAQRAKQIKNTAILNEDTCGSVAALQAEISRLKSELEQRETTPKISMPPSELSSQSSQPCGQTNASNGATVSALRNQNTKLNRRVKSLKEIVQRREDQVKSLKRKLQQETMIRKCKDRRITYLSGKQRRTNENDNGDVLALQEEISILREQLDYQPDESIEWMLKYKEAQAKVDRMETDDSTVLRASEKDELETSIIKLMNEKDSLEEKLKNICSERHSEIDSILMDVTKLENANVELSSALNAKEEEIRRVESKLSGSESQLVAIQVEMKSAIECLESVQSELLAERENAKKLLTLVGNMKTELKVNKDELELYKSNAAKSEDDLLTLDEKMKESNSTFEGKITEMQRDLDLVLDDNDSLMKKLKAALESADFKSNEISKLEREKKDLSDQIESFEGKKSFEMEVLENREQQLKLDVEQLKKTVDILQREKSDSDVHISSLTSMKSMLENTTETLKTENAEFRKRIETLQLEVELSKAKINSMQSKVADSEKQIETLIKEKSDQNDVISQEAQRNADMKAKMEAVTKKFEKEVVGRVKIQSDIASLEEKIASLQNENEEVLRENCSLTHQLDKVSGKFSLLTSERDNSDNELKAIAAEKLTLTSKLEDLTSLNDNFGLEIRTLKNELKIISEEKKAVEAKLKEISEKYANDTQQASQEIAHLKSEITKLSDKIEELTAENEGAEQRIDFSEADAERTVRLHHQLNVSRSDDHNEDMSKRDKIIDSLRNENERVECELKDLSKKLVEVTEKSDLNERKMKDEIRLLKQACEVMKERTLELKADIDTAQSNNSKQESEYAAKREADARQILDLRLHKESLELRLREAESRASQYKADITELDENKVKIDNLECLINQMKSDRCALLEEVKNLKAEAETGKRLKIELETVKQAKASLSSKLDSLQAGHILMKGKISSLTAQVDQLEREKVSLLGHASHECNLPENTSFLNAKETMEEPNIMDSDRNSIQCTPSQREPSQDPNCSLNADDSFDESMFLPNVEADENKTPIVSKMRRIFSPSLKQTPSSSTKARTPNLRTARSSLTPSVLQNSPQSSKKTSNSSWSKSFSSVA